MKKKFGGFIALCLTVLILFSAPAYAQQWIGWSGWLGRFETRVGSNITERDDDTVSHINWKDMESAAPLSISFIIKSTSGAWVSSSLTLNSNYDLGEGKDFTVSSNCIESNEYSLYATTIENVSSGILCGGAWEP